MRWIALALMSVLVVGCSDTPAARRALEAQGFKDIVITGHRWWGCSENDTFRTGFKATTPTGTKVSGVVCSGWFKGSTVRTF